MNGITDPDDYTRPMEEDDALHLQGSIRRKIARVKHHTRLERDPRDVGDDAIEQLQEQVPPRQVPQHRSQSVEAQAHAALKDDFLAMMSHELKHPLNLINVNTAIIGRLLDAQADRSAAMTGALTAITQAVRSQTRIIDDLLDLSRIRTGELSLDSSTLDLAAFVGSAVEAVRLDSAAVHLQILLDLPADAVHVHADPARLSQILWNLLDNAVKFTPAQGRISVKVLLDDGCGVVEILDTGQGIDPEALPDIFEMFGQAHARAASKQPGLGIGLALVKQLAVAHGGHVEAHSDGVGRGARFALWLPLVSSGAYTAAVSADRTEVRCSGIQILVVDDDPATAEALQILLGLEGAVVAAATSGREALRLASTQHFDLVITDLGMAGMDGYALLEQLKADPVSARWPVIALTGFGRERDILSVDAAGFAAHVAKPVSIDRLLDLITDLVKRTPKSPI